MNEKKRLRRRCCSCQNIYDVWRTGDVDIPDIHNKCFVAWTSDPYAEEIHDDHSKMWICRTCWEESAWEI